jgi:hypothetical protein
VPTEVTDAGQGRLRVSYTAPRPGFYRLMLQSVGPTATTPVPLGDSPYSLQVRETPLLTATVDDNVQHAPAVEDKVALWEQIAMVEFGAGTRRTQVHACDICASHPPRGTRCLYCGQHSTVRDASIETASA